ncbi:MAG TPA: transposase, partial [Tepidiformaceae bacterium]|nr:transposase [Tepidiformaceae bacterium]
MEKFPSTLIEAIRYFEDPDTCREFVAALRWPNGVVCPREDCGSENVGFLESRKIWKCRTCRRQFSVKVGTIFEDSPIGLDKWLTALWLITS